MTPRKRTEDELRRANGELDPRKTIELRDSQHRLALIIDSSQDALIGKNLDGIADQGAYTDRLSALFTPPVWTRKYAIPTSPNFERRSPGLQESMQLLRSGTLSLLLRRCMGRSRRTKAA
jgi:hypothetical protein